MEDTQKKYGLKDFVRNTKEQGLVSALGKDIKKTFLAYVPTDDYHSRIPQTNRQGIGAAVSTMAGISLIGTMLFGPFVAMNKYDQAQRRGQESALWKEYSGSIPEYGVLIDESINKNGSKISLIHLTATNTNTVPYQITGHDLGIDGQIDEVFIMNKQYDPCDSVYFDGNKTKWNPSPSSIDKGKKPFTDKEIARAQVKLYEALENVKNDGNKIRHWTAGMTEKENWGLLAKPKPSQNKSL